MAPSEVDARLVSLAWSALSSGAPPMPNPSRRQEAALRRMIAAVLTEDRRHRRAVRSRCAEAMAKARRNRERQQRCRVAYEAGATLREIAANEDVSVRTVRHYLDAAGVAMRPRGKVPAAQRSQRI